MEILNSFPSDVRGDIHSIRENRGELDAARVKHITESMAIDTAALMLRLVPLAAQYAVAPVSRYAVGAVVRGKAVDRTDAATLYLGANIEFSGEALVYSLHAEQAAVANAWNNGETGIDSIAVSAPPCGYCRQFLSEIATLRPLRVLFPNRENNGAYSDISLPELLPGSFGPKDLGFESGLMSSQSGSQPLVIDSISCNHSLAQQALNAANHSYAPYTKNHAGCAIETVNGAVYTGRYAENAAYNPSLLPLNAALSAMNLAESGNGLAGIARAVLVEKPTSISQYYAAVSVLASCAPDLKLEYYIPVAKDYF